MTTQEKGSAIEMKCMASFIEKGFIVSVPYGNSSRYDFLVDTGRRIYRIQCKSATEEKSGNWSIKTRSIQQRKSKVIEHFYTSKEIDFFCTYINGNVYLVGVEECCGKSSITLLDKGYPVHSKYLFLEDCLFDNLIKDGELMKPITREISPIELGVHRHRVSSNKRKRKLKIPDKENFEAALRSKTFEDVAKEFHISKKRIFDIARYYGIELNHGRDLEKLRDIGTFKKISERLKEYYKTHRQKHTKSIVQMSGDKIIAEYGSCKEAANALGYKEYVIRRACNGILKTYKTYVWKYLDDFKKAGVA